MTRIMLHHINSHSLQCTAPCCITPDLLHLVLGVHVQGDEETRAGVGLGLAPRHLRRHSMQPRLAGYHGLDWAHTLARASHGD